MKVYVVDSFTEEIFMGNQAGVILLEENENFPENMFMQKLAAELKYSETVFVKKMSFDIFKIRYFTPVSEVDLCGHATIAAFHVLNRENMIASKTCIADTLAGKLCININKDAIFMNMTMPKELLKFSYDVCKELYSAFGLDISSMTTNFTPEIISTGLADILLPVNSKEALKEAIPNIESIVDISRKYNVVGIHVFYICKNSGVTAHCRNFAPLYGINEESATGTSNASLTYYLKKYNVIKYGEENNFIQGESMGRASIIKSIILKKDNKDIIYIGGKATILIKGDLDFII